MSGAAEQWYVIPCPAGLELTSIGKERGTHGAVYTLWECERKSAVWLGQSVPQLVRSINEKAVTAPEKRLHASSLYRCLRKEARKESHKSWKVEKFTRAEIGELNKFLSDFPSIVVTSKSPELWHCQAAPPFSDGGATGGGSCSGDGLQPAPASAG